MQNYDKLALLFEILAGSNKKLVSHKLQEIKLSKEYEHLSSLANKEDNLNLQESIDCNNIHTYLSALKLEENVSKLNETYNKNDEVIKINEEVNSSKQAKKIKLYMWSNKASNLIQDSLNISKAKLRQLKKVKFHFVSIDIAYYIFLLFSLYLSYDILLSNYRDYRLNPDKPWINLGLIIVLLALCFISIIKIYARNYAYLKASKIEKDINYQVDIINNLDEIIEDEEEYLEDNDELSEGFIKLVNKINSINEASDNNDVVDYCSTPKQYFADKKKGLITTYFIVFGVGLIIGALVLTSLIVSL